MPSASGICAGTTTKSEAKNSTNILPVPSPRSARRGDSYTDRYLQRGKRFIVRSFRRHFNLPYEFTLSKVHQESL